MVRNGTLWYVDQNDFICHSFTISLNFWYEPNPVFQTLESIVGEEQESSTEATDSDEPSDIPMRRKPAADSSLLFGDNMSSAARRMLVRRRVEEFIAISLGNASQVR